MVEMGAMASVDCELAVRRTFLGLSCVVGVRGTHLSPRSIAINVHNFAPIQNSKIKIGAVRGFPFFEMLA